MLFKSISLDDLSIIKSMVLKSILFYTILLQFYSILLLFTATIPPLNFVKFFFHIFGVVSYILGWFWFDACMFVPLMNWHFSQYIILFFVIGANFDLASILSVTIALFWLLFAWNIFFLFFFFLLSTYLFLQIVWS